MFKKRGEPKQFTGFFARNKLLIAITTLIGTIVGAGILGIPYVIAKAGFLYGLLLIALMGAAFIFLNLFTGEIVLRTKKQYQLSGYANKYLGPAGKKIMTFSMVVVIYGALTAYLIGEGATWHSLLGIGSPLLFSLVFFAIATFIVYRGIKATGKAELILISLLFLVVILMGIFSFDQISSSHLAAGFNPAYFFLPYGVILFALMGSPGVPEMQEVLGKSKKLLKRAVIIGSVIPIILYLLFTVLIVGIVGLENFDLLEPNQRIATIALQMYTQPLLGFFANLLAILAMFTSYLTLGTALTEVYEYDYKISRKAAFLLTFPLPLLIVLLNLTTFFTVIGITGAIAGGLEGILIILMYWKAKLLGDRKPEYLLKPYRILGTVLMLMFAAGIVYQVWTNLL